MGLVGIFFFINGEIIIETTELKDAEEYGDFKIHKRSHYDMWISELEKRTHKPYDYFPRGRVVYNYKDNYFRIFIDRCINKSEIIDRIKTAFCIQRQKIDFVDDDFHYTCHNCNKFYVE